MPAVPPGIHPTSGNEGGPDKGAIAPADLPAILPASQKRIESTVRRLAELCTAMERMQAEQKQQAAAAQQLMAGQKGVAE